MKANVSALKLINKLVRSLDKPRSQSDLSSLTVSCTLHEAQYLVKLLLSDIPIDSQSGETVAADTSRLKFLREHLDRLSNRLCFSSLLCPALEHLFAQNKAACSTQTLLLIFKTLHLTQLQEITVSLALLDHTSFSSLSPPHTAPPSQSAPAVTQVQLRSCAFEILKLKVGDFARAYSDSSSYQSGQQLHEHSGGFADTPVRILYQLLRLVAEGSIELPAELHKSLFDSLENDFPKKSCVLAPALYDKEGTSLDTVLSANTATMAEMSLASVIENLGPTSLHSGDDVIKVLQEFGVHRVSDYQVALVITRMTNLSMAINVANDVQLQSLASSGWSNSSLEQGLDASKATCSAAGWNPRVFVAAVKGVVKTVNWAQVVKQLDNDQFLVRGPESLAIVMGAMEAMNMGSAADNWTNFPIDFLLSQWSNIRGQLSWIEALIQSYDPRATDSFSFGLFPAKLLSTAESKLFDENQIAKPPIATWKCVDLLACLLRAGSPLAASNSKLFDSVRSLFNYPVKNCPDVLFFTLLHVDDASVGVSSSSAGSSPVKDILFSTLVTMFLDSSPSAGAVLHWAYHFQAPAFQQPILALFSSYYMARPLDAARIHKLLEGLHNLGHKAVQAAANTGPVAFGLEVVMHGANRDYFNLEKYLSDRIATHKEQFVMELIAFIDERVSLYVAGAELPKAHLHKLKHIINATRLLFETMSHYSAQTQKAVEDLAKRVKPLQQWFSTGRLIVPPPHPPPHPPLHHHHLHQQQQQQPNFAPATASAVGNNSSNPLGTGMAVRGTGSPIYGQSSAQSMGPLHSSNPPLQHHTVGGMGSQKDVGGSAVAALSHLHNLSGGPYGSSKLSSSAAAVHSIKPGLSSSASVASGGDFMASQQQQPPFTSSLSLGTGSGLTLANAPSPTTSAAGDVGGSVLKQREFSGEIETETNNYFMRIYSQSNPLPHINQVLELLKNYKNSSLPRDKDIYLCMMRNLLEEYQFFEQYPDKELHTTALLFGGVIQEGLMEGEALRVALQYILDTLKDKADHKNMFLFALTSLDRLSPSLHLHPHFCARLAALPCFDSFSQHLKDCISFGQQEKSVAAPSTTVPPSLHGSSVEEVGGASGIQQASGTMGQNQCSNHVQMAAAAAVAVHPEGSIVSSRSASGTGTGSVAVSGGGSAGPSLASSAANIDILVANADSVEMEEPSKQLQEKVAFVFNNISQSNVPAKVEELRGVVTNDKFYPWLSRYLVVSRITMETNFHALYASFLDCFDVKSFSQMVLTETIRNIKVLLTSEKVVMHNFSDRALLKNLGKWLGIITLAKDKPILQRSLDLRSLLLEAFVRAGNEMTIVIPFVAKVMESAAKSVVFQPPNPWTMAILSILCEIHKDPSLKLNLKFEVEMLGKLLNIDIAEVQKNRPCHLNKTETMIKIVPQLAPRMPCGALSAESVGVAGSSEGVQLGGSSELQLNSRAIAHFTALQQQQQQQQQHRHHQQQHSAALAAAAAVQSASGSAAQLGAQQQQHQQQQVLVMKQPQYAYQEINHQSVQSGLTGKIRDNYSNSLFHQHPTLRHLIKPNIEKTVQELLTPLIDRSVRIAVITCEQMIKKDFALDPEEMRMKTSAFNITRHLTATMTLITCKEPLLIACTNSLKNAFLQQLRNASIAAELVQSIAHGIANDNLELCVAFTQKSAIEKALVEIEKKLSTEFDLRRHARNENRRYCDPKVLTYQAERMPEQLRMKVGTVTPKQLVVYEEFGREIPGFANRPPVHTGTAPTEDPRASQLGAISHHATAALGAVGGAGAGGGAASSDDLGYMYSKMVSELEQHLKACQQHSASRLFGAMQTLLENVAVARNSREILAAISLLSKTVDSLLQGLLNPPDPQEMVMRFRDCHLLVLKALQDPRAYGAMWTNKNVTKALIESREPNKYCVDGIDCLIKTRLVNMQQFDMYLTAAMENGFNYTVVSFAMKLVYKYLFDEATTNALLEAKYADLYGTIEMLIRIGKGSRSPPEELSRLIEMIGASVDNSVIDRQPGGPIGMMHSGISQAREFDDPPGLKEKTDQLLREWVTMYHSQNSGKDSTKAFSTFVTQMHTQGILKTDDLITRFFRICTEVCVDVCYRALNDSTNSPNHSLTRARCYHTLDAFVRLIALLVRHSGDAANTLTKINLLNKVLGLLTGVLLQDHELKNTSFQQLPYHRIFIMLFMELCAPDEVLDGISFQVLTAFSYALHVLRPSKAPGFAYAWLELISNRIFIARMLHLTPQQKAWAMYAQLLIDQFRFLAPFLRNAELTKPVQLLYKGTLRVLLVLLHDFPEFLCDHHYVFADVIPPNCIQMRNLILSAFPRHMRLPDPFTPDLKVDQLSDIKYAPRILHNFAAGIPSALRKDLDLYLKSRSPVEFLSKLRNDLQVSSEPGMRYNVQLMNAVVLYVGVSAITVIQSAGKMPQINAIQYSPHMDVYQHLAVSLDTEGRYLFLNAIANHLRYPNNHTHYFSCVLLYLFAEAHSEHIQEQITRVLLERVIVNRPHPWGLLITFIELINNPNFKFWQHEFVRCAPEIEKLFDSVAKSCMQRKEGGGGGPAVVPSQGGSGIPSGGALSLPPSAAAASAVNVSSSTASASGVGPAGNTGGGSGTNAAGGAVQSTNVTLACPPAAASSTQQVRNDQVVSPSSANIMQAVTVNNSEGHTNSG